VSFAVSAQTRRLWVGPLPLESGDELPEVEVAYRTWGRLDPRNPRAALVCHALTGSADVDAWWPGLLGPGRTLDPERELVICSNVLGSCYGTTGPASVEPRTGRRHGGGFPPLTVRDMVRLQARLLDRLGVERLAVVIGASLGGMQALEWAATFPARVESLVAIATSARHSAWCIGLSAAQRQAIEADPRWLDGRYAPDAPPASGLAVARMIAMSSYRSWASFGGRFGRERAHGRAFAVEDYLRRQGDKLVARFDAASYVALTRAMDSHDVGRGRGGVAAALASFTGPALVVAIDSDVLYPPPEQEELAAALPRGRLARLHSPHGHDAFLIAEAEVDALVRRFRQEVSDVTAAVPPTPVERSSCAS